MKFSAACILCFSAAAHGVAVTKVWTFQDGTNQLDKVNDAALDIRRNIVYLVGTTYGDYGTRNFKTEDIQDYYTEFVAIKLDFNTGKKVWTFQDQGGKDEQLTGATIEPQSGDLIAAGTTQSQYGCPPGGCTWMTTPKTVIFKDDFMAIRVGVNSGKTLWKWQYGTSGDDTTNAASINPSTGELVVVGSTVGSYGLQRPVPNRLVREYPYDTDLAATRVTKDGKRVSTFQLGSNRGDKFTTVTHGADGSIYMAGETFGSIGATNTGDRDVVVVKQNAGGGVLWRIQFGTRTASEDYVTGIAVNAAGDAFVAGYYVNAAGNEDFWVKKLKSSNGQQLWTWTEGTADVDILSSITVGSDNTIVAAGYTAGAYNGANAGGYDAVVVGLNPTTGAKLWAWQNGSNKSDRINSITAGAGNTYLLAGETYGALAGGNKGDWDFLAMKISVK